MNVMFLGDTHANVGFFTQAFHFAAENDIPYIIQVGDFGYWPRGDHGKHFLEEVSDMSMAHGLPIFFVDGNHEDHDHLNHAADEPTMVAPQVYHLPRGSILRLGSSNILAFGGAVSVDRHMRSAGLTWFDTETASFDQQARVLSHEEPIDIIVAHDIPSGVDLQLTYPVTEKVDRECRNHRSFCLSLLDYYKPRLWVGGHYHQRWTQHVDETRVEVLAHDIGPLASAILIEDV